MFEETVHLFGHFQGKLNPYLPFISIYNGQHMMSLKFDNFIFSWTVVTGYTWIKLLYKLFIINKDNYDAFT